MKEFIVTEGESGQKCLKYCEKILPNAGSGFLHKMMRKKNITINGKKTDGNFRLSKGDIVRFFFSDETFIKFSGQKQNVSISDGQVPSLQLSNIIYEDEHILLYNKPVGVLSQKAKPEDVSLNEMLIAYLSKSAKNTEAVSKASICNRLDRNTSGIVICGKTYMGLRSMSEILAKRSVGKFYHCLVKGKVSKPITLTGFLTKDAKTNKVSLSDTESNGSSYIETEIYPILAGDNISLLEVHLITGKTHQIRSHLASVHHPIIGDHKYGDRVINAYYKQKYGLKNQLLHAYRIEFPEMKDIPSVSNKKYIAEKPALFLKIEKEELHGNMEFQRT